MRQRQCRTASRWENPDVIGQRVVSIAVMKIQQQSRCQAVIEESMMDLNSAYCTLESPVFSNAPQNCPFLAADLHPQLLCDSLGSHTSLPPQNGSESGQQF